MNGHTIITVGTVVARNPEPQLFYSCLERKATIPEFMNVVKARFKGMYHFSLSLQQIQVGEKSVAILNTAYVVEGQVHTKITWAPRADLMRTAKQSWQLAQLDKLIDFRLWEHLQLPAGASYLASVSLPNPVIGEHRSLSGLIPITRDISSCGNYMLFPEGAVA